MSSVSAVAPPYPPARQALADILPLSLAVVPWGLLCGSLALQAGLTPWQAQCLSLLVFAGAAQLAAIGLISGGVGAPGPILSSTAIVSARHLLYSAVLRQDVREQPLRWRLGLAFLLTDELFVVVQAYRQRHGRFHRGYALAAGLTFYLIWNLATLAGIVLGQSVAGLERFGFDFAIAAIFLAMAVPQVTSSAALAATLTSALVAVACHLLAVPLGLLIASVAGMAVGYGGSRPAEEGAMT